MAKIIGAPTLDDALAALRRRLEHLEGERCVIFCEDRLTLLAERAVLDVLGGTFSVEVTTFARFLSGPKVLSKQGSVMEISALIAENEGELSYFRGSAAQAVYETIAQLSASKVDGGMLRAGAEETEGTLKGKLLDLAFLLEKYTAALREKGLLDENAFLALLPDKMEELRGVHIVFFGFPSFTKQALEGVRAALLCAKSVTGIFLAGRSELYTNEGARAFRRAAEETGAAEPSQVGCSLTGAALFLRDGLFSPERFFESPLKTDQVRRFTARDEAEELGIVAALIKKHVSEGLRYRDFAVLVPDKEGFLAVERAFSAYRIPFFADKKRAFSAHPFCSFLLDILSAVSDGALPDEADAVASSVYFGRGDNYRNYLLKFGGYRGAVRREIKSADVAKGYDVKELSACRERMLALLALFPRKGKGGAYVAGVRRLRELVGEEKITEELKDAFTGAEWEFLDLKPLDGLLAEIEMLAGERPFTAREFSDALKSGLDSLEISLIPQSADSVFVGDATESKFERVRVLFATGLTDALPRASQDTAVITDGEMEKLSSLSVEIEPAIAQVNARARESLGLNLCAFTDRLYLSYPLESGDGETERSEILQYAEKLFEMPPMPDLFPFDCCEKEPAALKFLALKNSVEAGGRNEKEYAALFETLKQSEGAEAVERLVSGGEKEAVPAAGEMYFSSDISPTLLENYFACPYQGFASRALKLREREERTVMDTDAGTFVHTVLEQAADRFNETEREEDCRALARNIAQTLLASPRFSALADTKAGEYMGGRLVKEAEEVACAAFRQLKGSQFEVAETEGRVAIPELSLSGKTDRIDRSDDFVRVIDYKTGDFDDTAGAYYTGRRLQLELYLRAAARGGKAAGAFYFPAAENYVREGEERYRMGGFFCADEEVLKRLDKDLAPGQKSAFFDGKLGSFSDKGMPREDFERFLDYGALVSASAEREMKEGNIAPSPYEGACTWCKLKSLCGFVGSPRKEGTVRSGEIVKIVRRERGEE